jgi:hypothetical protein
MTFQLANRNWNGDIYRKLFIWHQRNIIYFNNFNNIGLAIFVECGDSIF